MAYASLLSAVLAGLFPIQFHSLPAWDDVLVTQPFEGHYSAGVPCNSEPGFMLAEDCHPTGDFVPCQVELWLGFHPTSPVEEYNFGFQMDDSGSPDGTFFRFGTEVDIVLEDIGLSVWGLDFYHVIVAVAEPPVLASGQPCWFCFQAVSSSSVACLLIATTPNGTDSASAAPTTDNRGEAASPATGLLTGCS